MGLGPRSGEPPSAPNPDRSETERPPEAAGPDPGSAPSLAGTLVPSRLKLMEPPSVTPKPNAREVLSTASEDLAPKTRGASEGLQDQPEISAAGTRQAASQAPEGGDVHSHKEEGLTPVVAGGPVGEDPQQRTIEATVCAKNIKVSSTGEKVVLWTRWVPPPSYL